MDVSRGVPRAANHHGMRRDAVSTAQLQRLRAMARGSDSGAGTHTGSVSYTHLTLPTKA